MTYTPEELREAILISVCLGLIIGGCLGFIWAAWVIEAKSTGRINISQAASEMGKLGRTKQLQAAAGKRAEAHVELIQAVRDGLDRRGYQEQTISNGLPSSQAANNQTANLPSLAKDQLNQFPLEPVLSVNALPVYGVYLDHTGRLGGQGR